ARTISPRICALPFQGFVSVQTKARLGERLWKVSAGKSSRRHAPTSSGAATAAGGLEALDAAGGSEARDAASGLEALDAPGGGSLSARVGAGVAGSTAVLTAMATRRAVRARRKSTPKTPTPRTMSAEASAIQPSCRGAGGRAWGVRGIVCNGARG